MERSDGDKKSPTDPVRVSYFHSIAIEELARYNCQECVIENYSEIKRNTNYSMTKEDGLIERTLKLYKTKSFHNFKFQCEFNNRALDCLQPLDSMCFQIMYDEKMPGFCSKLQESDNGYCVDVPNEKVLHADNKYLHEHNKLVLQYVYGSVYLRKPHVVGTARLTKEDREALSKDLLFLKESAKFSDFVLESHNNCIQLRVHKAICGIHMPTFPLDYKRKLYLTNISSADIAVRFMYEGKLPDLPYSDLMSVARVANNLRMPALKELIGMMMRKKINRNNCSFITDAAVLVEMDSLVDFAIMFDSKNP